MRTLALAALLLTGCSSLTPPPPGAVPDFTPNFRYAPPTSGAPVSPMFTPPILR